MNDKNWYALVLAGGSGQRMWPLSREDHPKQLLPFNGSSSLLKATLDRVAPLVAQQRRWVITTAHQEPYILQAVGDSVGHVLAEPAARNTAAAIAWACLCLEQQDPHAVALFLSADHYIPDQFVFLNDLSSAAQFAQEHNVIALLGAIPRSPATGYGYIEYDPQDTNALHPVLKFHEKPSLDKAVEYKNSDRMLWNTGMFCGTVRTFIQEFELHAPQIIAQVRAYMAGTLPYTSIDEISFDHAVMEKSRKTVVLPANFTWCDVGNLEIFLALQNKTQNINSVFSVNSHNNLVHIDDAQKHVALIGVDDLCIIDTQDALLVAKRSEVDKVKLILDQINTADQTQLL